MPNFENAFKTVCELVKDFKENEHRYLSPQYQEAEVRRDFIDKLFEALGWDVYHRTQKNPYEQEVKVEKGVSVGKAQKRADYAFYITPEFRQPKFFCEAKKPSRCLKNSDDYFQTIRYGWNSNTPVAVLTDFEEFHVLDCRYKPKLNNVLENPNHKSYSYNDYANPEKFKEIYYLFSRDDVAKNSLEKYSESFPKGKAKGKTSFKSTIQAIDDDFLEYIDEVRETLAKAFKKNDAKLSSEELTEATQRTIDRIVFIRFLEDKLIEPEYYISEFGKRGTPWSEFISVCRKLDAKYNGIVFKKHFIDEQNFQGPEQSTFKKICDEMSYLNSSYDFNAIPIHILGSIYERFLGKVVNATAQRVKVEEKPEVRKAGGVYYTPKYIVDYIVDNTVGKILRNEKDSLPPGEGVGGVSSGDKVVCALTPSQISKLRFADIACGSGSFLIGVFETLLKYHTEYYQAHPEEAKKDGCINKDGLWILSIKQKQNILINNIYGVDIDNQAVEVTQLSLALKMLEDESTATANEMQVFFHEKILPDLSKNIVCGNSLIGTDIVFEESSDGLFERKRRITVEEERKLNPMDFEKRFPHIFQKSNTHNLSSPLAKQIREASLGGDLKNTNTNGFDAIVGNPPYTYMISITQQEYFKSKYKYQNYQKDLYLLFLERYGLLLKSDGILGVIVSNTWLQSITYKDIRRYLVNEFIWNRILHLPEKVFKAVVDTNVLIFQKNNNNFNSNITVEEYRNGKMKFLHSLSMSNIPRNGDSINIVSNQNNQKLFNEIKSRSILLKSIANVFNGVKPFEKGKGKPPQTDKTMKEKPFVKVGDKPSNEWKPLLRGSLINRYTNIWNNNYWILYGEWLAAPRNPEIFLKDSKIIIRQTGDSLIAVIVDEGFISRNNLHILKISNSNYHLNYLLGLINSRLLDFYYAIFNPEKGEALAEVKKDHVENLPIKPIDFQNETEKQSHDRIVYLVNEMLEAKKQLQTIKTDRDKTYYENKCTDLDHAIDSEVYKLYTLTDEEIKIVEGKE